MGDVSEVHRYEYPVTALQFDSRKVVACTGENGIEVSLSTLLLPVPQP
jgi:division protein 1